LLPLPTWLPELTGRGKWADDVLRVYELSLFAGMEDDHDSRARSEAVELDASSYSLHPCQPAQQSVRGIFRHIYLSSFIKASFATGMRSGEPVTFQWVYPRIATLDGCQLLDL
jgi:hypothetical protein